MARRLNLPARTWYNYETGVTVPAEVLLSFIDQTGTSPTWLLSGQGPKYLRGGDDALLSELSPVELIRRGLEKLESEPTELVTVAPEDLPADVLSEFVALGVIPLDELTPRMAEVSRVDGYVLAYREWIPHPGETVSVRLRDDAMHPILPAESVVAIDRTSVDPRQLNGQIVAARPEGETVIRWLEITGRHLILRPNLPSREHPLIPIEQDVPLKDLIIGQVVWSCSRHAVP